MTNTNLLAWIDLEMTGLNPEKHHIIEIACLVTDSDLNIVAEGPEIAIHQDDDVLDLMNEWNINQHNSSGLVEKIKASDIGLREAEQQSLHFFQTHIKQHKSPLCGSSVSHDRRFLIKHMPKLANHFHYRHIDVSSFKEVIKRWSPDADEFKKESSHRAMDDIKDSVNELKFYREKFFK
jgi:oligoribonuclease